MVFANGVNYQGIRVRAAVREQAGHPNKSLATEPGMLINYTGESDFHYMGPLIISKTSRQIADNRAEALPIPPPGHRIVETLRRRPGSAQGRLPEKVLISSHRRIGRAKACEW